MWNPQPTNWINWNPLGVNFSHTDQWNMWQSTVDHSQHLNHTLDCWTSFSNRRGLRISLSESRPVLNVAMDQRRDTGGVQEPEFLFISSDIFFTALHTPGSKDTLNDETYYLCSTSIDKPLQLPNSRASASLITASSLEGSPVQKKSAYRRDQVPWH